VVQIKAKIMCLVRPKKRRVDEETEEAETATIEHCNLNSLIYKSTRRLYQQRLDEKLLNTIKRQSVDEIYKNVINSIKAAARKALGIKDKIRR